MQVTIDLPDLLQPQLLAQAEHLQISIESLILQAIHQYTATQLPDSNYDPITPLIGTLDLGTTDLGEHHDYYLGQALLKELHSIELLLCLWTSLAGQIYPFPAKTILL